MISYDIKRAAETTGLHRNTIAKAIREKKLPARLMGDRRVIIFHEDLLTWLRALPSYRGDSDGQK